MLRVECVLSFRFYEENIDSQLTGTRPRALSWLEDAILAYSRMNEKTVLALML